ncbi:extracellular solute-binding protein [Paenibacillus sp. J2TS4]|uniref:extracellular solute-binding protein n=1 Tax=Paenibacillus sp. J2TS4 TaxID=2807194 RepID=UPI001B185B22|nr:extracellular solute-binding protein [Paenibacillus sp. J2TS4]GIP31600.1 lipoprotein LipO [Paenibacillus sp. J2TS4]
MKRNKQFLLALALMMTVTACSSGSGSGSGSEAGKEEGKEPATQVDKKHKITGITYIFGNPPPASGEGQKKLNERFNVDYKVDKVPQENFVEKLTAIVSGGDIPDMIGFRPNDLALFQKWAGQKAFLPLDEYIDKYESFKAVPKEVWDQFRIDGKIYGIPSWAPLEGNSFMIRKDWLDNLGLEMPTSYEELKEVAIAFAKNDPDQNGKDDTYGLAIGQNINPDFAMGPYWQYNTWYHQDADGNYIPGIMSEGRKEIVQFLHDLHQEKAITSDFAVLNWADTNDVFYKGKAGVFLVAPRGMSQAYMEGLLQLYPDAEFAVIPPFEAPDGSQGFTAGTGFARFNAFSAQLAKDPDKLAKIFEMHDFSRTFYPSSEQNASNADFDWFYGGENVGYNIENGKRVMLKPEEGIDPAAYFQDNTNWIPSNVDPEFDKAYTEPKLVQVTKDLMAINGEMKRYFPPNYGIISETENLKGAELLTFMMNEQTKMIAGQRPISDWDALVEEYLKRGGADIIKEINDGIKERGYSERIWK